MRDRAARYGCLLVLFCGDAAAQDGALPADAAKVQARRFDIDYEVNEAALPLTRVELWYSLDRGQTWHNFGLDPDRESPIAFDAAQEGLYGFYFVLANDYGVSASPPQSGTVPQQWTFVDYTPPILQLRDARVDQEAGQRMFRIRWSALDANFDARPIELTYRTSSAEAWRRITEPLANFGAYDWRPPEELVGEVSVRVAVTDRGGHRIDAVSRPIELDPAVASSEVSAEVGAMGARLAAATQPSEAELLRAEKVFERGMAHRERGEYRLAVSRFRDALAIDPRMTAALVALGETMYFQAQHSESIQAYRLALEQEPALTGARRGLARSLSAARHYEEAALELGRILDEDPRDAGAWLDLGDVALWRGDEALARDCWRRAESIEGRPEEVAARAKARLADIAAAAGEASPE